MSKDYAQKFAQASLKYVPSQLPAELRQVAENMTKETRQTLVEMCKVLYIPLDVAERVLANMQPEFENLQRIYEDIQGKLMCRLIEEDESSTSDSDTPKVAVDTSGDVDNTTSQQRVSVASTGVDSEHTHGV